MLVGAGGGSELSTMNMDGSEQSSNGRRRGREAQRVKTSERRDVKRSVRTAKPMRGDGWTRQMPTGLGRSVAKPPMPS